METKERKKRPTVAQIVQLEEECKVLREELEAQLECKSKLVADCDEWREKYRKLLNRGLWARLINRK